MRRLLAATVLTLVGLLTPAPPASADACVTTALCAVSGCVGTVNVCPTARYCSGGVSVCPYATPANCHSTVDVCLGYVMPAFSCSGYEWVCRVIFPE